MDRRVRFCGVDLGSRSVHVACLVSLGQGDAALVTASAAAPGPWSDRCPEAAPLAAALRALTAEVQEALHPEAGAAPGGPGAELMPVQVGAVSDRPGTRLLPIPAAASLPAGALVVKAVNLPAMRPRERRAALYLEMGRLTALDPAETVGDWLPLAVPGGVPGPEGQGHLLLMARQAAVDAVADALWAAHMRPVAVEPEPAVLVRLALLLAKPGGGAPEVLIDLGAAGTRLVVVRHGELLLYRDLPVGGADLTADLAQRIGVSAEEAEALKCTAYQEADSLADFAAAGERLVREVERSLRYVERLHGLDGYGALHLVGGGARWPLLRRSVEAAVGRAARPHVELPVGTVSPKTAQAAALSTVSPKTAGAAALALWTRRARGGTP